METSNINLRAMRREELTSLLEEVMIRLRLLDSEDIRKEFVTKSQRLRLESPKNGPLPKGENVATSAGKMPTQR